MTIFDCYPELLTVPEAAEALRISVSKMKELIKKREITYVTIGETTLVPKQDLSSYVEKCRHLCYDASTKTHLDNSMEAENMPFSESEPQMAIKINQAVIINGQKRWVSAKSVQEFADKIVKLACTPPAKTYKHPFDEYAWNWFYTYSEPNIAAATAITYKRQINTKLIPAFEGMAVEDITPDDVQRLFNSIDGKKSSKEKARMVLNQILQAAVEDKLISRNPLASRKIKITGAASKITEPYTLEQMRYLVQHIDDIKNPTDRAYLALQILHPLRLEEVLGLKGSDIDMTNMTITVRQVATHPDRNQPTVKNAKTIGSHRTICLSSLAPAYIPETPKDQFILGGNKPYSYSVFRRMCERIQRDTGFDESITPTRFRTTVLTDLYEETKDLKLTQHAAGHSTPRMTLEKYIKGRDAGRTGVAALDRTYSTPAT